MIIWKDFILDDEIGPHLFCDDVDNKCREARFGSPSVMEDAIGKYEAPECVSIQETGQGQRPARMVGLSSLDSAKTGMEASRRDQTTMRQRGTG